MTKFFTKRFATLIAVLNCSLIFGPVHVETATAKSSSATDQQRTITIVTTIRPLELIVRDLIGEELQDRFAVTSLLAPNVSPHGYEPTASQVARLHRADVVILNGAGLDDWAGRNLPRGTLAISFAEIAGHHHHHHDHNGGHAACCAHGHSHNHGSEDEHFWLDVELVKRFAGECSKNLEPLVRDRFADADRTLELLVASRERFGSRADDVDQAFVEELKSYQHRRIVTHHNVFSRIASRHDLGEPLVLRPLATAEPTPRDLRRAIRTIRAERIAAILVEPQFSSAAAERIRDETNVRLVQVDPLGGEASSWAEMMDTIRAAILQSFDRP